jgi:hypothetical protein
VVVERRLGQAVLTHEVLGLDDALMIFRNFHDGLSVPDAYAQRDITHRNLVEDLEAARSSADEAQRTVKRLYIWLLMLVAACSAILAIAVLR